MILNLSIWICKAVPFSRPEIRTGRRTAEGLCSTHIK